MPNTTPRGEVDALHQVESQASLSEQSFLFFSYSYVVYPALSVDERARTRGCLDREEVRR